MTIQPEFSPLDFFRRTLATTPSPSRISTRVPMNSPRNGPCILIASPYCNMYSASALFNPIKRAGDRFLPEVIKLFARFLVHLWLPTLVDSPVDGEFVAIFEEADSQARGIGRSECSSLLYHRTHHRLVQYVGLKLHQQIVHHHSTIGSEEIVGDAGILR